MKRGGGKASVSRSFIPEMLMFSAAIGNWSAVRQSISQAASGRVYRLRVIESYKGIQKSNEHVYNITDNGKVVGNLTLDRAAYVYSATFTIDGVLDQYIKIDHDDFEALVEALHESDESLEIHQTADDGKDGGKLFRMVISRPHDASEDSSGECTTVEVVYNEDDSTSDDDSSSSSSTSSTEMDSDESSDNSTAESDTDHGIERGDEPRGKCGLYSRINELLEIGSEYSSDFSDVSSDCSLTLSDISDSYDHSEDHAMVDEALRKECPAIESATRIVHINTLGEYKRLEFLRRKQCDEDNGTVMEDGQDYKVKKHWRVRCYRSVGTGGDSDYDMKEVETLIDEDILGVLKID